MACRALLALAIAAAACGTRSDAAPRAPDGPAFPRIATYFIESHVDAAARAVMARADVVIVDAEAAALDRAAIDALRAANPALRVLAYLTSEELPRAAGDEHPLADARFAHVPAGAWLTDAGSTLTRAASPTDTTLHVADGAAFAVTRPRSAFYPADEPTYLLVDGEHVRLRAVDGDRLVVERGVRSRATAHAAGARVASHVVFFGGTWMLNLAADAWRARLVDDAAGLVARGPWTGVFLDVCFSDIAWLNAGQLDLDRDGVTDDPEVASARWSAGMGRVVDALRARLGPEVPIVANPGAQDCPHPNLDGILLEGWPIGMPPGYLAPEVGEARYARWAAHGRGLTIANGFSPAIGFGTIAPGQDEVARTDYARMRYGLAAALMHDGLYAYDNGVFGHYVAWWYDEYDGAGRGRHWLGRALGPARARGALRWREFEHGLAVVNTGDTAASFVAPPAFARLAGRQDPAHNNGLPVIGPLELAARDGYLLVRR